jgi:hypothetical protein
MARNEEKGGTLETITEAEKIWPGEETMIKNRASIESSKAKASENDFELVVRRNILRITDTQPQMSCLAKLCFLSLILQAQAGQPLAKQEGEMRSLP